MHFGILAYTIIWVLAYGIIRICYKKIKENTIQINGIEICFDDRYKQKLSILAAIIISGLFTLFNIYVTMNSSGFSGDRQNYSYNFGGVRETPSFGLAMIINMIKQLGGNIQTLFYFTTFVCVFITLIAYRNSKYASPYSFFLLCLTQYFITTLTAIKQSYASALAVVFFVLILEHDTRKSKLLALLCAFIACLFHPTGYILFIIWIVIGMRKTKRRVATYFIFLLILGIFLKQIMPLVASFVRPISSSLYSKIMEYFGANGDLVEESSALAFLKGIPYYTIAIMGIVKRRIGKNEIEKYDNYLMVVGTGAFLYLISIYNVWFSRFVYLFSFISFVFLEKLMRLMSKDHRLFLRIVIQGILFFVTYRFLFFVCFVHGAF